MDLSIVILNWKVKDLLKKCLASVYAETKGINFEVFVVDNDSRDGSVEMVLKDFPQATLMANTRNLGFAAGNNPAIARAAGDFVILLNPDTEIVDNALGKMVAFMRRTPQAGICGPKLLGADGSLQRSVRRFPSFVSQLMIALKLHHVAPKAAPLRRYFAEDFDYDKAGQVDQVMGAAFMVRRSVLEAIGLLDERFFVWFEEVDYCKRAADAGFQIWYTPEAKITHRGGESFGQVFGPTKQRLFNDSMRKYFAKHNGLPAAAVLALAHPASMALAWFAARPKDEKPSVYRHAMLLILLFEIISFIGFLYPTFSTAAFLILMALAVALAMVRFDLAVAMLLVELFIGSQGGYLVSYGPGDGINVSLRIGLFLVVFGFWVATTLSALLTKNKEHRRRGLLWLDLMRRGKLLWPYLALLGIFALGLVIGVMRGNDLGNVFFDANGYAFFALFPAIVGVVADPRFRERLPALLSAAVTVSVLKALFVLFVFSHRMFFVAPYIYTWVRDTRVGEITKMVGDFYRVFFQAHLYALMTFLISLLTLSYTAALNTRRLRGLAAIGLWSLTGVVMGFSRSFWFGAFAALLAMAALFVWGKADIHVWKRAAMLGATGVVFSIAVVISIYYFPFPRKGDSISFASLLGGRAFSFAGEAAANSRWALLPELNKAGMKHPILGSGLGTTVTYTTSDPRLLADLPTGEYITFAFEWGYHDLWVKFGILGLAVYAWLIWAIMAPAIRTILKNRAIFAQTGLIEGQKEKAVLAAGLSLAIIALLATNVFSPYLNHPLGIGILMLVAAYGVSGAIGDSATGDSKTVPTASR